MSPAVAKKNFRQKKNIFIQINKTPEDAEMTLIIVRIPSVEIDEKIVALIGTPGSFLSSVDFHGIISNK